MEDLNNSRISFEDKHIRPGEIESAGEGIVLTDGETISCRIPELSEGERIVLNAWGRFEVHHYDDYRRRFGIYSVVSKKNEKHPDYVLRREKEFSEGELAHMALTNQPVPGIEGLKYIELDRDGNPI